MADVSVSSLPVSVLISSYQDTSPIGLGPIAMAPFHQRGLLKDSPDAVPSEGPG